jgi:4-hydroxybenzoate polyprenyltransferase
VNWSYRRTITGLLRLVHPFPSTLDAAVTVALALLAGASGGRAALLGAAMLAIQFSIGAFNDLADAPADARAGRAKPLVDGRVPAGLARGIAALTGPAGLVLAALAGPAAALVALTGYGIGLAYDLGLKASPWSWLPYATGIPLLPVFAWVGATGRLPIAILVLAGLGAVGGAALAIANALADVERDASSGTATVAAALGTVRAMRLGMLLSGIVGGFAVTSAVLVAGPDSGTWLTCAGAATLAGGVWIGVLGHLQRAWEMQAIGLAILAAGWVAALAAAGIV